MPEIGETAWIPAKVINVRRDKVEVDLVGFYYEVPPEEQLIQTSRRSDPAPMAPTEPKFESKIIVDVSRVSTEPHDLESGAQVKVYGEVTEVEDPNVSVWLDIPPIAGTGLHAKGRLVKGVIGDLAPDPYE